MNKTLFILIITTFSLVLLSSFSLAENSFQENYTFVKSASSSSAFTVTLLRYDPFPVNAGEYFDLWVKVQNIGEESAKNSRFELIPSYPFFSEDKLTRDYGIIYGTSESYKSTGNADATAVVMKFRIGVDSNAPVGISNITFKMNSNFKDSSNFSLTEELPITIAKTKTDFDVKVRSISPQEISLVISNTGSNLAKGVSVEVKDENGVTFLSGREPSSLGDLNQGEFTIAHIKALPDKGKDSLTLVISYTDISGVRTTQEEKLSINTNIVENLCQKDTSKDYMKWIYIIIGIITGIFLFILFNLIKDKNHSKKLANPSSK